MLHGGVRGTNQHSQVWALRLLQAVERASRVYQVSVKRHLKLLPRRRCLLSIGNRTAVTTTMDMEAEAMGKVAMVETVIGIEIVGGTETLGIAVAVSEEVEVVGAGGSGEAGLGIDVIRAILFDVLYLYLANSFHSEAVQGPGLLVMQVSSQWCADALASRFS